MNIIKKKDNMETDNIEAIYPYNDLQKAINQINDYIKLTGHKPEEMTCYKCEDVLKCEFAYDCFNINGFCVPEDEP